MHSKDPTPNSLLARVLKRSQRLSERVRARVSGGRYPKGAWVEVGFGQASGQAQVGWTLLQAAKHLRVDLDHFCGGFCSCGTCRVAVDLEQRNGLSRLGLNEEVSLGPKAVERGDRLACQACIVGPVSVRIPESFNGR